jgi:hypothetical protein
MPYQEAKCEQQLAKHRELALTHVCNKTPECEVPRQRQTAVSAAAGV